MLHVEWLFDIDCKDVVAFREDRLIFHDGFASILFF